MQFIVIHSKKDSGPTTIDIIDFQPTKIYPHRQHDCDVFTIQKLLNKSFDYFERKL
jgi:hypothetical protein